MLTHYLICFLISMLPLVELRGAIPYGLAVGLPVVPTYVVCVLGNMLPVPFIYLFARRFLIWGCDKPVTAASASSASSRAKRAAARWRPRRAAA
jgi:uncharacterized membrane protein